MINNLKKHIIAIHLRAKRERKQVDNKFLKAFSQTTITGWQELR